MKRLNRALLTRIGVGVVVAFAVIQFIPVAGVNDNPTQRHELQAPAEVKAALQAACYDCHSNETKWPWYSRVAPISWRIASHVDDGRAALNFSDWATRPEEDKQFDRENLWEMIDTDIMPLGDYLLLHPEAVLSDEQKRAIESWALKNASATAPDTEATLENENEGAGAGGAPGADRGNPADGGTGGAASGDPSSAGDDGAAADDDKPAEDEAPAGSPTNGSTTGKVGGTPAPKSPSPAPKSAPKPAAPKPSPDKPKTDKPKTEAPAVYDGPNPCRSTNFKFSNVRAACQRGGVSQAKSLMKYLVNKAKDNGTKFKCSSCHSNQKTYTNKPNSAADFRKLMDAAK